MSDKIRETFEQHAREVGLQLRYEGSALATAEAHAAWRAWQAALAKQPATAVPDGWRLVPVEPTPEMVEAYSLGKHRVLPAYVGAKEKADARVVERYRAMLSAAPAAPVAQAPVQMHHEPHNRAMWHENCPGRRFSSPMKPRGDGSWECGVCGAVGRVTAPPAAEQPDAVKVPRELLERIAAIRLSADDTCKVLDAAAELRDLLTGGDA